MTTASRNVGGSSGIGIPDSEVHPEKVSAFVVGGELPPQQWLRVIQGKRAVFSSTLSSAALSSGKWTTNRGFRDPSDGPTSIVRVGINPPRSESAFLLSSSARHLPSQVSKSLKHSSELENALTGLPLYPLVMSGSDRISFSRLQLDLGAVEI